MLAGRSTKKKTNEEPEPELSTSKTEKRSRSKSNASKRVTSTVLDADIDAGKKNSEKQRRSSSKVDEMAHSKIPKISQKSKSTISKSRKVSQTSSH